MKKIIVLSLLACAVNVYAPPRKRTPNKSTPQNNKAITKPTNNNNANGGNNNSSAQTPQTNGSQAQQKSGIPVRNRRDQLAQRVQAAENQSAFSQIKSPLDEKNQDNNLQSAQDNINAAVSVQEELAKLGLGANSANPVHDQIINNNNNINDSSDDLFGQTGDYQEALNFFDNNKINTLDKPIVPEPPVDTEALRMQRAEETAAAVLLEKQRHEQHAAYMRKLADEQALNAQLFAEADAQQTLKMAIPPQKLEEKTPIINNNQTSAVDPVTAAINKLKGEPLNEPDDKQLKAQQAYEQNREPASLLALEAAKNASLRRDQEEQARIAAEELFAERVRITNERLEAEQKAQLVREQQEQAAAAEFKRVENERIAREKADAFEAEIERQQQEQERQAKAQADALEQENTRLENERKAQLDIEQQERLAEQAAMEELSDMADGTQKECDQLKTQEQEAKAQAQAKERAEAFQRLELARQQELARRQELKWKRNRIFFDEANRRTKEEEERKQNPDDQKPAQNKQPNTPPPAPAKPGFAWGKWGKGALAVSTVAAAGIWGAEHVGYDVLSPLARMKHKLFIKFNWLKEADLKAAIEERTELLKDAELSPKKRAAVQEDIALFEVALEEIIKRTHPAEAA